MQVLVEDGGTRQRELQGFAGDDVLKRNHSSENFVTGGERMNCLDGFIDEVLTPQMRFSQPVRSLGQQQNGIIED